jgi:hypothetical protein
MTSKVPTSEEHTEKRELIAHLKTPTSRPTRDMPLRRDQGHREQRIFDA